MRVPTDHVGAATGLPVVRVVRKAVASRTGSYLSVIAAIGVVMPLVWLALARHLGGLEWLSFAGLYVGLVLLGYYGFILMFLTTVLFTVFSFSRRVAVGMCGALLVSALFYLVINGAVYRVYRLHIDAFWLQYLFSSYSGIGIPAWVPAVALGMLVGIALLVRGVYRVADRIPRRGVLAGLFAGVVVVAYLASQAVHIVGYEMNDTRITSVTPRLPFYFPITSHRDAVKYGSLLPMIAEQEQETPGDEEPSFRYPLRDVSFAPRRDRPLPNILMIVLESWRADTMNETVSPRMYDLSRRSSVFRNHFSSGNSTPSGVFSLFYGLHPTYWTAVKANSATIDNPVLMDALQANGYAFGIFADSHFDRHKIKDGMFRGIEVHEDFEGRNPDQNDQDLTERLSDFAVTQAENGKPFFGFAFYKSTHFSYYYPRDRVPFAPTHKLNIALASNDRDPALFLNDYRNAVNWVDTLVGNLLDRLESAGILQNTIVVITSDHGEEFNDNRANYWGHTGNFTGYQTKVPLIIYVPWEGPRQVTAVTAHIDIPATLLVEGLGCAKNVEDYSNGVNLFAPFEPHRPLVISSYVNHAVVVGDDVFVIYPMYVQKYKLWDINAEAGSPPGDASKRVIDEMHRFYDAD